MSALNRQLRALAFSGKARSMVAADLEAFVRERERAAAEKACDEAIRYLAPDDVEIMWAANPYRAEAYKEGKLT